MHLFWSRQCCLHAEVHPQQNRSDCNNVVVLLLLLLLLQIDLPPPTLLKPLELWTGKQLFGLLVRPNAATR
jgi:hypothetical protein